MNKILNASTIFESYSPLQVPETYSGISTRRQNFSRFSCPVKKYIKTYHKLCKKNISALKSNYIYVKF